MTRNRSGNYINFPQFTHSCYLPFPQEHVNEFKAVQQPCSYGCIAKRFLLCVLFLGLFRVEGPDFLLRLGPPQSRGLTSQYSPGGPRHLSGEPSKDRDTSPPSDQVSCWAETVSSPSNGRPLKVGLGSPIRSGVSRGRPMPHYQTSCLHIELGDGAEFSFRLGAS